MIRHKKKMPIYPIESTSISPKEKNDEVPAGKFAGFFLASTLRRGHKARCFYKMDNSTLWRMYLFLIYRKRREVA